MNGYATASRGPSKAAEVAPAPAAFGIQSRHDCAPDERPTLAHPRPRLRVLFIGMVCLVLAG